MIFHQYMGVFGSWHIFPFAMIWCMLWYEQMNAHLKCPSGHIDLSRYVENDKQQGSTRLSTAEIHALESFYYGLNR